MATTPGVPLTGLTDTADLTNGTVLVPDATADGEAVNKGQMDAADALKAPINDPTFTGNVVVPAPPPPPMPPVWCVPLMLRPVTLGCLVTPDQTPDGGSLLNGRPEP